MNQTHQQFVNDDEYLVVEDNIISPAPILLRLAMFFNMGVLILISGSQFTTDKVALLGQLSTIVLATFTLLLGFMGSGWKVQMPAESICIALFAGWCTTGFLVADNLQFFIKLFMTLVKTIGMYLLIVNIVRSRNDFLWLAFGYVAAVLVFFFLIGPEMFVSGGGDYLEMDRATGISGDANASGVYGIICVIVSIALFSSTRNKILKICFLLPTPIFIYMILSSGSRSGFLGLIIVMVLVYWWFIRGQIRERGRLAKFIGFMFGAILIIGIGYYIVASPFWGRVERTFGFGSYQAEGAHVAGDVRIRLMLNGLKLAGRHPIFGVGFGQFRIAITEVSNSLLGMASHNTWIEAAASAGILGFALWLTAAIIITRRISKLRKNPFLPIADRGIVSLCLIFMIFWWFRSFFFIQLGDKIILPFVAGITGYATALGKQYNAETSNLHLWENGDNEDSIMVPLDDHNGDDMISQ